MEEWLSSWFTSKPGIIRKGGVLKKTIVNRSETFGREGFENLVKYPRKNRRKRVRPKRYRNYTHRAKHSIM